MVSRDESAFVTDLDTAQVGGDGDEPADHARVRLGRDYYVRVDSNDYSVDPRWDGSIGVLKSFRGPTRRQW
jgi:hypothetical protein